AATLGLRSVTVSTASGTSNSVQFTVNPGAPTLASISPSSGTQGTNVPVTLSGTNFVSGATTIAISGSGVTGSAVTVVSETSITATFTISPSAASGTRSITVNTALGTSNAISFTVNVQPSPAISSVSPNSGVQGQSVAVTIAGANFVSGGTTVT